jgi:E3 ubiquitin-protein ligase SHPRH
MRSAFEGLFRAISIRTTKKEVTNELHIPRQTRYVVPIDLSEIEMHYYNDTLDRQREQLRRQQSGTIDRTLLRACLLDLRQICTHIQVGQMHAGGSRADQRLRLGKDLMTMSEALEKMKEDHSQEFLVESRLQV